MKYITQEKEKEFQHNLCSRYCFVTWFVTISRARLQYVVVYNLASKQASSKLTNFVPPKEKENSMLLSELGPQMSSISSNKDKHLKVTHQRKCYYF